MLPNAHSAGEQRLDPWGWLCSGLWAVAAVLEKYVLCGHRSVTCVYITDVRCLHGGGRLLLRLPCVRPPAVALVQQVEYRLVMRYSTVWIEPLVFSRMGLAGALVDPASYQRFS